MKKQFSKDLFVDILNDLQRESDTLSELYDKYRIDYIDCDWIRNDISVIKLLFIHFTTAYLLGIPSHHILLSL
jgi:hypothetical protein